MAKEITIDPNSPEKEAEDLAYLEELGTPGDSVPTTDLVPAVGKRVQVYDSKVAEAVLMKIADGATLREIAREPGMPTKSTVQRWIMKYPELAQAWKAARELSASSLEEESLDMARVLKRQSGFTGTKIRAFEVAMNQFRWSASHRDPATYGQTAQAPIVVPIQINTSLDLGDGKGGTTVTSLGAQTTYEVAAKYGEAYNANHAQIEGTDYTMEPGQAKPVVQTDIGIAPDIDTRRDALEINRRKSPGRPRKGHKSEVATKRQITRNKKKELKDGNGS